MKILTDRNTSRKRNRYKRQGNAGNGGGHSFSTTDTSDDYVCCHSASASAFRVSRIHARRVFYRIIILDSDWMVIIAILSNLSNYYYALYCALLQGRL